MRLLRSHGPTRLIPKPLAPTSGFCYLYWRHGTKDHWQGKAGMWPFRKKTKERDTEAILSDCDFGLARAEIAGFFRRANDNAQASGREVIYRKEFVHGWETFADNPCRQTAIAWLKNAPDYSDVILGYFSACCPGGLFWAWREELGSHYRPG